MDVLYAFIKSQELRALIEPTSPRPGAATAIFNLPDYRVTDTEILTFGQRRVRVEAGSATPSWPPSSDPAGPPRRRPPPSVSHGGWSSRR
jgi:hypothetical protein